MAESMGCDLCGSTDRTRLLAVIWAGHPDYRAEWAP